VQTTSLVTEAFKASFAPVTDERTRVLILGSLPGEVSLAKREYYGNRQNMFWRLLGDLLGAPLPEGYAERLTALRAAGIGLWDVIGRARRAGSLDANIRDHEPNALDHLVSRLSSLQAIAFNGSKASVIGRKLLAGRTDACLVTLPSSSPARAMAYAQKLAAWRALEPFLPARPDG